jgi:hypothetical protein
MAITISNSYITKLQMVSDSSFNIFEDFVGTAGFISASAINGGGGGTSGISFDELVLYFDPSDESSYSGTGTTINDISGYPIQLGAPSRNGNMLNLSFTSPYLEFPGFNAEVEVSDNNVLEPGSGDFTLEAWINHSVITGKSRIIVSKAYGGNASDWSYGLRTNSAGSTYFEVGNGTTAITSPSSILTTNTWYQIVGVWSNVASNSISFYVNGNLIGSNSHSFASVKNVSSGLFLGSFNGGEYDQPFQGKMGIFRMYRKALSSDEVLSNYNADKSKYGL